MENNIYGKYLFHYTKMSKVIESILNNFELQFSKFGLLNDPLENKKFSITFWQNFSYKINDNFITKMQKSNDIFYNNSYILCFSIDEYINKKKIKDGFNFFRMWSQYGENYKGVCLIIDRRKILNDIYNIYKNDFIIFNKRVNYIDILNSQDFKTSYKNENLSIKPNEMNDIYDNILKHIKENKERLYFTKDFDWKGENEYRIVLFKKKLKENINNKIVPITNSLKGIVLGYELNKNYEILFKNVIKDKDIKLFKQEKEGLRLREIIIK